MYTKYLKIQSPGSKQTGVFKCFNFYIISEKIQPKKPNPSGLAVNKAIKMFLSYKNWKTWDFGYGK